MKKWSWDWWKEYSKLQKEGRDHYGIKPKQRESLNIPNLRRLEKQIGPRWVCRECKSEYRVKTPFRKLYCSECLRPLKCLRLFSKGSHDIGMWIYDDDLRRLHR